MKDVMIDLETLDTESSAVIISLGACLFDIEKKTIPSTFYMALEIQEQIDCGRTISASTIKWWLQQDKAAQYVFKEKAKPVAEVLQTFVFWLNSVSSKTERVVWGNGSTFDISMMQNIFKMYELEVPWNYNGVADLRTFKRFVGNGEQIPKPVIAHNALEDAKTQAQYVLDVLTRCGL